MDKPSRLPVTDEAAAGEADAMFARRGCCCFWIPWSAGSPPPSTEWWERMHGEERRAAAAAPESGGGWWKRGLEALMKLREWSELVAGPRWKTFIRRFNRNSRHGGGARPWKQYQYDPLSYALNFDEGRGQEESADPDGGFRDFSSRYAAIPSSAKASMDLGGRDAPPLFDTATAAAAGH